MNRLKNLHKVFFATCFIVTAILFSLVALPTHFEAANAQSSSWRLKETRVFNNMDGNVATITAERYDASGGSVDLQLSGNILSTCPGGYEKLRFTWSFPNSAKELVNGGGVTANLDARQVSRSQNCGTQLASRSLMYMYGGQFTYQNSNLIDRERFLAGEVPRAYAAEYTTSGTAALRVNTHNFDPKQPYAYFEICIATPTRSGGGNLCYAYLYENAGGSTGGGGNSNFTIEYDTDRRGGDYKDFDLSQPRLELCRDACANDSNCRAFTYVKPGGQGPNARCWLKSSVPSGESGLSCCISGVKR